MAPLIALALNQEHFVLDQSFVCGSTYCRLLPQANCHWATHGRLFGPHLDLAREEFKSDMSNLIFSKLYDPQMNLTLFQLLQILTITDGVLEQNQSRLFLA